MRGCRDKVHVAYVAHKYTRTRARTRIALGRLIFIHPKESITPEGRRGETPMYFTNLHWQSQRTWEDGSH